MSAEKCYRCDGREDLFELRDGVGICTSCVPEEIPLMKIVTYSADELDERYPCARTFEERAKREKCYRCGSKDDLSLTRDGYGICVKCIPDELMNNADGLTASREDIDAVVAAKAAEEIKPKPKSTPKSKAEPEKKGIMGKLFGKRKKKDWI